MSAFILNADYDQIIEDDVMEDLINLEPSVRERTEKTAISRVASYLNSRYDTVEIFNKTGDDRHDDVVWAVLNITLYLLHQRLHPNAVPEHRADAYNETKRWLNDVSCSLVNPVGLPVPANGDKDHVLYGGETKRQNRLT